MSTLRSSAMIRITRVPVASGAFSLSLDQCVWWEATHNKPSHVSETLPDLGTRTRLPVIRLSIGDAAELLQVIRLVPRENQRRGRAGTCTSQGPAIVACVACKPTTSCRQARRRLRSQGALPAGTRDIETVADERSCEYRRSARSKGPESDGFSKLDRLDRLQ